MAQIRSIINTCTFPGRIRLRLLLTSLTICQTWQGRKCESMSLVLQKRTLQKQKQHQGCSDVTAGKKSLQISPQLHPGTCTVTISTSLWDQLEARLMHGEEQLDADRESDVPASPQILSLGTKSPEQEAVHTAGKTQKGSVKHKKRTRGKRLQSEQMSAVVCGKPREKDLPSSGDQDKQAHHVIQRNNIPVSPWEP